MATKYKQGPDGYWSTQVWDGTYTASGSKHRKEIRSKKSSKDLEQKVAAFKAKVEAHDTTSNSDVTFLEFARLWRLQYKSHVRPNTQTMYDNIIEKHFIKLEGVLLTAIDKQHLYMLLNKASANTGRQIYLTFKQVIKEAVRVRIIPQVKLEDIFADTAAPKAVHKEKRGLTDAERNAIKDTTLSGSDKAYLWLAYGCGLRREEILALTVSDITADGVEINKVITFDGNNPRLELDATKSHHSRRCVPLPGFVADYMQEYLPTCKNYVIGGAEGPITKMQYRRMWERIIKSLNAAVGYDTKLTSHMLRHNYCSALCYQIPTISIKTIAKLMGDTEAVVLKVYNHILEEKEDKTGAINNAL